jgi:hypothetical protein
VGGVSQQGQAAPRPVLKRLAIEEPPSKRRLHLGDDSLNSRVPARELSGERPGIADGRPGFLQRLVGRHEPHVIDELVGPHGKDQKMLGGSKPVAHGALGPGDAPCRDHAPVSHGTRIERRGWNRDVLLQH